MKKFTKEEMKKRAIKRVAEVIFGQWEEGRGVHSRIFEVLVPDEFIIIGQSVKGSNYREHIVPCSLIRDYANEMYSNGSSIDDVTDMIEKHLFIVKITQEEAKYMDNELQLKTIMPKGWKFNEGNPLARLHKADIVLI